MITPIVDIYFKNKGKETRGPAHQILMLGDRTFFVSWGVDEVAYYDYEHIDRLEVRFHHGRDH